MLDKDTFKAAVAAVPLVSVDLVVMRGETEVLLGLRQNRPAQGYWFVPGGRIYKDETIEAALERVAQTELGLGAALSAGTLNLAFMGPYQHFYTDCFAGDVGISTHYVVLGYRLHLPAGSELPQHDAQHAQLSWWPVADALVSPQVHRYTKDYLQKRQKL